MCCDKANKLKGAPLNQLFLAGGSLLALCLTMPVSALAGSIDLPSGGATQVISGGSTIAATDVLVGNGGSADLTVTGSGTSLTATGDVKVGLAGGTGTLSVLDGAELDLDDATAFGIGIGTDSNGSVIISGKGSTVTHVKDNNTNTSIGQDGVGLLQVSDGASFINSGSVYVGTSAGGKGIFDISGDGTSVSIDGNISIACAPGSTQEQCGLKVSDGATLDTYAGGFVGTGGQGNALVTGAGTTWNEHEIFQVGANYDGSATAGVLRIEDGAKVNAYFNPDEPYSVVFGWADVGFNKLLTPVTVGDDETGKVIYESGGTRYFVDTSRAVSADVVIDGEGSEFYTDSRIRLGTGAETNLDENGNPIVLPVTVNVTLSNGGTISAVKERADGAKSGILFDGRDTYLNIGAKEGDQAQAAGFVNSYYLRFDASNIGNGPVGNVVFNHTSDNFDLWSEMVGNGNLRSISGDTTLSGHSADFTGNLYVKDSTVRVTGLLGPDSTSLVDAGGLLTGTGTIGAATVAAGGRIGGGARTEVGTLTTGDLTIEEGGALHVRFDETSDNDLVNVTGDATFEEGSKLIVDRLPGGNISLDERHLVMTVEGERTGELDGEGTTLSNFYKLSIAYDQEDAGSPTFVYLDPTQTKSFADVGKITKNERAVTNSLQATSVSNPVVNAVAWLPNDDAARSAYQQLSGVALPDVALTLADEITSVSNVMLQKAVEARGTQGADLWVSALGNASHYGDDGNAPGFDASSYGLLAGIGIASESGFKMGGSIGVSSGSASTDGNLGDADSTTLHGGGYLGYTVNSFTVLAGGNAASSQVNTSRRVDFGTLSNHLSDDGSMTGGQLFAEVAYRQDVGSVGYAEPFVRYAHVATSSMDVSEHGGEAALNGDVHSSSQDWGTIGIRMGAGLTADALWGVDGAVGYRRLLGGDTAAASLAFEGGAPFVVDGSDTPENVGLVGLNLSGQVTERTLVRLSYDGAFGSDYYSQSLSALVAVKF